MFRQRGNLVASVGIRNVRKNLRTSPVFRQVSIDGSSGEFIIRVGASQCYISTVLRAVAGLENIITRALVRLPEEQRCDPT